MIFKRVEVQVNRQLIYVNVNIEIGTFIRKKYEARGSKNINSMPRIYLSNLISRNFH